MPTYEYECGHCGRFQITQRITEPALTVCPTCGQPVRRLISRNVGIIFKGSGFYCTDHRGNTCLNGSGDGDEKPAAAAGKPGAPEAKPAEKSAAEAKPAGKSAAEAKPAGPGRGKGSSGAAGQASLPASGKQ